jgi:hypothetical protein
MVTRQSRRAMLLSVALVVCLTLLSRVAGAQEGPPRSVTTGVAEGETWLKWDPRTKLGFVRGYLMGIRVGSRSGCFWYDDFAKLNTASKGPSDTPLAKCLQSVPIFSKPPEHYVRAITDFYQTYPGDRGLNLESLISKLSDREHKTLSDIDGWFRSPSNREYQ